ncbi:hypothetical protein F5877DRAFT_50727, partial [Lentinula edodes]
IDEAARNAKTSLQKYGRAKRGHCCVQRRQFVCGERVSILPAITLDGIGANRNDVNNTQISMKV